VPDVLAAKQAAEQNNALDPATRAAFLKAVDELRAAGATVVMDDSVLPDSFAKIAIRVATYPYVKEGTDLFLKTFGPAQYHSAAEYDAVVGQPLGQPIIGTETLNAQFGDVAVTQRVIETDPEAQANFYEPRQRLMDVYLETMDRLHLDGYVYPAIQMPPVDETMPQNGPLSGGPHSDTSWVNMLGVPAVVVVGGFYPAACRSGSRSLPGRGTMATCWDTPMLRAGDAPPASAGAGRAGTSHANAVSQARPAIKRVDRGPFPRVY
jgi:amidase